MIRKLQSYNYMHVIFITIRIHTNAYNYWFSCYLSLQLKIHYYYRLDTATEEDLRHLEHHDTKISIFENVGLFSVFGSLVILDPAESAMPSVYCYLPINHVELI